MACPPYLYSPWFDFTKRTILGTETRQYDFCHIGDVFEVNEEVVVDAEK